jgi:Uma2 family endonuclease
MESTQVLSKSDTVAPRFVSQIPSSLPDHTQLPDSDGTFVKNFQEHPQSLVLTSSIEPVLQQLHPDGRYCIGQNSGIYWNLTDPPERGAEAPDWFYVPNVNPLIDGEYRRSYVMWKEFVAPLIAIEFVSGNGSEERDNSPPTEDDDEDEDTIAPKAGKKKKAGKFWVYERAIRIPFYAIYEVRKASVELYRLVDGCYEKQQPNNFGRYPIVPMGVEIGILFGQEATPIPWLRFWDMDGNLLLTGDERAIAEKEERLKAEAISAEDRVAKDRAVQAQQQAELAQQMAVAIAAQEREQKEKLETYLRSFGINPDEL